ncbi:hypothetical protein [Alcaligenes aquatilis]|uniref:hypothetical protein n=1 Tax=Alcaligenes aquatilis TaxID=323284 RepID=UPI0013CE52B4|nr:hypothetical protein [Alcaligenes aquatilis]
MTAKLLISLLAILFIATKSHSEEAEDKTSIRQLACTGLKGTDVTEQGELHVSDEVGAVVVCHVPRHANDTSAVSNPNLVLPQASPFENMTVAVHPPSGTVTAPAGAAYYGLSCSADLYAATSSYFPDGISNGQSTVRCQGRNSPTGASSGCSVEWVGPTSIQLGVEPYGGSVVVSFTCFRGGISPVVTFMDYSYSDGRFYKITRQNVSGSVNVIYE